jgi:predicted ATPase
MDRCAGIRDLAHGGQTLVAAATASLVADAVPAPGLLVDHGVRRLRDLARSEHVYELRHRDLRQDFPPVRSLDMLPNNLPTQLTSFVGRSAELGELERLLSAQRLVTLAGAGGCGKSRLAVQAAAAVVDRWPDGVWWVDLGSVTRPAQVTELTAATLRARVEPASDPAAVIAGQLGKQRLLLCLDTCEHVLDAAARLVDTVLRRCPAVSVVATSREPLGVAGETVWRVPPLVDDEAVQLFNDRAALVRPGIDLSGAPAADVRTICRRLDGIPLAIELAAAWMRALTPAQIVGGLDDRFRLLTGGPRVATRRQQTLAASMEWSHDLLADDDRVVFRRLAVFAGGFTLDAAAAVCADDAVDDDVLAGLGRLVDKSLVVVTADADQATYRMQDTIRQMEPILRAIESQPDVDVVGFMVVVGQLHLWSGDLEGAVAWLERGTRFAAPHTDNWTAMRSVPGLAGALRRLGRVDEAVACVERGVPLAKAFDGPLLVADVATRGHRWTALTTRRWSNGCGRHSPTSSTPSGRPAPDCAWTTPSPTRPGLVANAAGRRADGGV